MAAGINFDLISVHKYIELSGQYLQLSKISLTHVNLSFQVLIQTRKQEPQQ